MRFRVWCLKPSTKFRLIYQGVGLLTWGAVWVAGMLLGVPEALLVVASVTTAAVAGRIAMGRTQHLLDGGGGQ